MNDLETYWGEMYGMPGVEEKFQVGDRVRFTESLDVAIEDADGIVTHVPFWMAGPVHVGTIRAVDIIESKIVYTIDCDSTDPFGHWVYEGIFEEAIALYE